MRISDWSSDVCSSDLPRPEGWQLRQGRLYRGTSTRSGLGAAERLHSQHHELLSDELRSAARGQHAVRASDPAGRASRSLLDQGPVSGLPRCPLCARRGRADGSTAETTGKQAGAALTRSEEQTAELPELMSSS